VINLMSLKNNRLCIKRIGDKSTLGKQSEIWRGKVIIKHEKKAKC
jgi:hypothetical protein